MPAGMQFFVPGERAADSDLFSESTKKAIKAEAKLKPRSSTHDEAVADLVERHFGREMMERVADPLLMGIYGADSRQLSVQAVLPRFVEIEARHGSLIRGLAAQAQRDPHKPLFTSLKRGMQQLADTIAQRLEPASIQTTCVVNSVRRSGDKWQVSFATGSADFDALIVAVPAFAAADILKSTDSELAEQLARISYTDSVVLALGYSTSTLNKLPAGFGFLVPRSEKYRTLACTFVHNKFQHRAPQNKALLRIFMGGIYDNHVVQLGEEQLASIARHELREILDVTEEPEFVRVFRWRKAMPVYEVGHLDLVQRIREREGRLARFRLIGNGYKGVGVPDCIREGKEAAEAMVQGL